MLKTKGRAAIVVPDNVLFEGGAGETVRRGLLKDCYVLPCCLVATGVFARRGSRPMCSSMTGGPPKALGRRSFHGSYDLRTNEHFTLKTNSAKDADLEDLSAATIRRTAGRGRRLAFAPSPMMSWSSGTRPAWISSGSRTRAGGLRQPARAAGAGGENRGEPGDGA